MELGQTAFEAYKLGVAASREGRLDDAIAQYTQAIRFDPSDEGALQNRAMLFLRLERWDDAIADCTAAIAAQRYNPRAYNMRGRAYTGKGQYERAVEDHTAALVFENEGLWSDSHFYRGIAYLRAGEHFKAIADFDRAEGRHALLKDVVLNRAAAYEAIGEPAAAREDRLQIEQVSVPCRDEVDAIIRTLLDGWCERRALGALAHLLRAWPVRDGFRREWIALQGALGSVGSAERKAVTNAEIEQLLRARDLVKQALRP